MSLPPFERVFETHGAALLRFCAAHVGTSHADDCFQETMIAALRGYDQLRDAAAIRAWLYTIATRKAIDMQRARARMPVAREAGDSPDGRVSLDGGQPDDGFEAVETDVWLDVRELPEKQRHAVTLRYLGDLSYREISQAMKTTEVAARRNVFEGLRSLRERVDA